MNGKTIHFPDNMYLTSYGIDSVQMRLGKESSYYTILTEHFDKTVTIYCNAKDSSLHLKVTGNAK